MFISVSNKFHELQMFNLEASRRGWQQARLDGREAHVAGRTFYPFRNLCAKAAAEAATSASRGDLFAQQLLRDFEIGHHDLGRKQFHRALDGGIFMPAA